MVDHSTNRNESVLSIPLEVGDTLFINEQVYGEITAITDTALVRYVAPADGEEFEATVGKATLMERINNAESVTIR